MIHHPAISVLFILKENDVLLDTLFSYLQSIPSVQLTIKAHLPADIAIDHDRLEQFVLAGGGWLELVYLSDSLLPPVFGVRATPVGPRSGLRVMFQNSAHPMAARCPDATYVTRQLGLPKRQHYTFYWNLADHLLFGEPIIAPVEDSVRVIAILEAAARSAAHGGSVEALDG